MTVAAQASRGPGPGFDDPTLDSQSVFRVLLEAMSRPGMIGSISAAPEAPSPLDTATTAVGLCLFDHDTNVWLGDGAAGVTVYEYLRFHCGCPLVKSSMAADFAIAIAAEGVPGLTQFNAGSDAFPDRSTTLILQVADIGGGAPVRLTGPGIESEATLRVAGVPAYFWTARHRQQDAFPRGIDLIFTCGNQLVALPRSTKIEV